MRFSVFSTIINIAQKNSGFGCCFTDWSTQKKGARGGKRAIVRQVEEPHREGRISNVGMSLTVIKSCHLLSSVMVWEHLLDPKSDGLTDLKRASLLFGVFTRFCHVFHQATRPIFELLSALGSGTYRGNRFECMYKRSSTSSDCLHSAPVPKIES